MKNILIIDDNHVNLNLLYDILSPIYSVITAKDGFQGLQLALEHKPILIICDIMMPKMNGYEVLKNIRESSDLSTIPFIFLTAKAEKSDLRFGMDCGADDYLTKPFTQEELIAAIESRLKRKDEIDNDLKDKVNEIYAALNTTSSHEFNTPLNAIMGFTSLLISNYNKFSKDDIIKMLKTIQLSSKRLYRTTNNIILHTYLQKFINNQHAYPEGETLSCEEIISNTIFTISDTCDRRKSVVMEIENAKLAISENDLSKIIEEIVLNGINFSKKEKNILINTSKEDGFYKIKVVDFGRGIKQDNISKIGPYVQFEREFFEQQGMGLGLYLAKTLAELNHGNLSISSKENIGTEVTILIPLK